MSVCISLNELLVFRTIPVCIALNTEEIFLEPPYPIRMTCTLELLKTFPFYIVRTPTTVDLCLHCRDLSSSPLPSQETARFAEGTRSKSST